MQHLVREAIRASSAAPGYYEECQLGELVHMDGGLLTNNPTAIAIHECRLLWPETPLQCVISIGTGKYEPTSRDDSTSRTSLKRKVTKLVESATDTEGQKLSYHGRLIISAVQFMNTLSVKVNRTPETSYYNFAKIVLMSIKIGTQNLDMMKLNYSVVGLWCVFLAQHKLVEKVNVVGGVRFLADCCQCYHSPMQCLPVALKNSLVLSSALCTSSTVFSNIKKF